MYYLHECKFACSTYLNDQHVIHTYIPLPFFLLWIAKRTLLIIKISLSTFFLPLIFFSPTCLDYFSLKSGSRPSSPGPSPTPSVAGSVTSTSSSARQRRPLISPARLNISGQKLQLFASPLDSMNLAPPPASLVEPSPFHSRAFVPDVPHFPSHNQGTKKCFYILGKQIVWLFFFFLNKGVHLLMYTLKYTLKICINWKKACFVVILSLRSQELTNLQIFICCSSSSSTHSLSVSACTAL